MFRTISVAIAWCVIVLVAVAQAAAPSSSGSELLAAAKAISVAAGDESADPVDSATSESADERDNAEADDASTDEDGNEDDGDDDEELDTYIVERKDLKVEIETEGVFVAEEMREVAVRPEIWTKFKVVKSVEHGASVRQGDMLVEFDDREFEETLAQKTLQRRIDELALMQAEEELPRTENEIELEYTQAKRAYDILVDEYKHFQETVRPMSEKMAMQNLASSQFSLESAREELEQLQKMYEADDLTEETEEIVLKRQKFAVARSELYLESAKINFDYTMNVTLPRRDESYTLNLESAKLAYDQAKTNKSLGLNKQRYQLDSLRESRQRSDEEHDKLIADRAMMELRAPIDGVVYYGRCLDGKFSEIDNLKGKLVPFGSIAANTVVMTVTHAGQMRVETSVGESDFSSLQTGDPAEITLVADDDVELVGSVEAIDGIPQAGNKFSVTMDVDTRDAPDWLAPGMTCKAKITVYEAEDVVVIPSDLLQTDEEDEDVKYVMVLDENGEQVRRDLELGEKDGESVEVLEGLDEGERVVKGSTEDDDGDEEDGDDD